MVASNTLSNTLRGSNSPGDGTARGAILLNPLDRALSVITRCDACPEPCPCRRCIGEEEARCGDICQGCRGSKFCGFMDRKKTPKTDSITADRVEDRLDMMRRRSS